MEVPEQRRVAAEIRAREVPPRLRRRPEQCGEEEPPGRERDCVAPGDAALRDEEVERVARAGERGGGQAEPVEGMEVPEPDDQDEARERQTEGGPDPASHGLA